MPAPGSQHDLNTGSVGPAQGIQVGVGNLDLGVQQRAIYINGDEANAALHELILAAVRYQLVNGRGFQPKHGEATNGKLFYKVFVAGGAGGCRIANNRVDCGPATAVAFRLRAATLVPGPLPKPTASSTRCYGVSGRRICRINVGLLPFFFAF